MPADLYRYYIKRGDNIPERIGATVVPEVVELAIKVAVRRFRGKGGMKRAAALGELLINARRSGVPEGMVGAAFDLGMTIGEEMRDNKKKEEAYRVRYASTKRNNVDPKVLEYSDKPR